MAELTSEERVRRVLRRQEPDRVPHFEWLVDRRVRAALCPEAKSNNDFAVRMGHDAVVADPDFRKTPAGPGRWLSEWGYVGQDTAEEHGIEVESPIKTRADFERYVPPDLQAPGRYASIEQTLHGLSGDSGDCAPERCLLAAALLDGDGGPDYGHRRRPRAGAGAGGPVGEAQPGNGARGGGTRKTYGLPGGN